MAREPLALGEERLERHPQLKRGLAAAAGHRGLRGRAARAPRTRAVCRERRGAPPCAPGGAAPRFAMRAARRSGTSIACSHWRSTSSSPSPKPIRIASADSTVGSAIAGSVAVTRRAPTARRMHAKPRSHQRIALGSSLFRTRSSHASGSPSISGRDDRPSAASPGRGRRGRRPRPCGFALRMRLRAG